MKSKFTTAILLALAFMGQNCTNDFVSPDDTPGNRPARRPAPDPGLVEAQLCFGESGMDNGQAIIKTADDNYVIAGRVGYDSNVSGQAVVVKIKDDLSVLFSKEYGGSGNDAAYDIIQTTDGGYLFVGTTNSFGNGYEGWVVKLDANGAIQWQKTLGGSGDDQFTSVIQTQTEYVILGQSESTSTTGFGGQDVWVVRLPISSTEPVTETRYGGSGDDGGFLGYAFNDQIVATGDGFVVSASTNSADAYLGTPKGKQDVWVFKIDGSTNGIAWQQRYGGPGDDWSTGIAAIPGSSDFLITARTYSNAGDMTGNNGSSDAWIARINSSGVKGSSKTLGGRGHDQLQVEYMDGSNIVLFGLTTSSGSGDVPKGKGGTDMWTVRMDHGFAIINSNVLGGSSADDGYDLVAIGTDGTYIGVGGTSSNNGDVSGNKGSRDLWTVKFKF